MQKWVLVAAYLLNTYLWMFHLWTCLGVYYVVCPVFYGSWWGLGLLTEVCWLHHHILRLGAWGGLSDGGAYESH